MEHNATITAPHIAIHPAARCSSSWMCDTDGPVLCHEMRLVCACAFMRAVYTAHVCVRDVQLWQVKTMTVCDIFWWDTYDSHLETNRCGFTFQCVKLKVALLPGCVYHSQRH